jgi:ABC-type multidrug transport system ATPase subunit
MAQKAGVYLQWRHLEYRVKLKDGKEKLILADLNGNAEPGRLLGIMGASGGGKTSLLSILTQRLPKSSYTGAVLVNGVKMDQYSKRWIGYVSQDVPFLSHLTCGETLMFAARLKLPESVPMKDKKEKVASLLALMDLTHAAKTKVGDGITPGGLSGGERRRLALAIELLNDPMLLFGDEITSGLDSASALRIVLILRKIARERNCTVVLSLHQPRADLLPLLDELLILAQGRCVYHGPTFRGGGGDAGADDDAFLSYFRGAGYPLPSFSCPTDAVLDILNADHDDLVDDILGAEGEKPEAFRRELPAIAEVEDEEHPSPVVAAASSSALDVAPRQVVIVATEDSGVSVPQPGASNDGAASAAPASPPSLTSQSSTFPLRRATSTTNKSSNSLHLSKRIDGKSRQDTIDSLVSHFAKSALAAKQLENPSTYPPMPIQLGRKGASGEESATNKYPTRWLTQVQVLLERTFLFKLRNPDAVMSIFFGNFVAHFF